MNKAALTLKWPAALLTGAFSLYCTLLFLRQIGVFGETARKFHLPYYAAAAIVVLTAGAGINIGVSLLLQKEERWLFHASGIFSIYFLLLQLLLTILPGVSSCKCTTLSESLMSITDWNGVTLGFALLAVNGFTLFIHRKP